MYLKEIKMTGFKSFADKMDIKLNDEVTCIVGPNGSGKSNVVDAVRWVLGEQSVKSLRGDVMRDVIFSGSKSRNPLNVSQVELIFDNSDHYLKTDFTDVSIKRKAYRSGENEYFLNNSRCRLKDISDLLMDTGVSLQSFNIIGQGEVDKIISNSPVDRKIILEEAAGVLKYKKRKDEAIRKLNRTHINLDRVSDVIGELSLQLDPLKEDAILAKRYLEVKEKLKDIHVALLSYDIYSFTEEKKQLTERLAKITEKLIYINNSSSKSDANILKYNNDLSKLETSLNNYNKELVDVTRELAELNSERLLIKEKNKITNKSHSEEEMARLLEEESVNNASISLLKKDIASLEEDIKHQDDLLKSSDKDKDNLKQKMNVLRNSFSNVEQDLIIIRRKILNVKNELDNLSFIPNNIKRILENKKLDGIHNTLGNLISVDNKFAKAVDVLLKSSRNFVVVSDEDSAIDAVDFLKKERLGRATFFPLNVIKERYIDKDTLEKIKDDSDFISVVSDLIKCEDKYKNIIKNQFGLVMLSPTVEGANRLSRKVNRRYKVISLDGDVVNVGGSITGGVDITYNKSKITLEQELTFLEKDEKGKQEEKVSLTKEIEEVNSLINNKDNEYFQITINDVNLKEKLGSKMKDLKYLEEKVANIKIEINSLSKIVDNKSLDYEKEILDKYLEKNNEKEILIKSIENTKEKIDNLKNEIDTLNSDYKLKNLEVRNLEKEQSDINFKIHEGDSKLDSMLITLNEEYNMTYEAARNNYSLSISYDEARSKVEDYKNTLKKIGMVNLRSIDEFDRVNTRYEFLCREKDDLLMAENSLTEIMNDMDQVIEEEFVKTYEQIDLEFSRVFSDLFGGGKAHLKLTDPNNILETGVEIVASPPGKKLKSISLLSGGEKTLTAISLLFAILNVREVPFCLFDEVEAALDEANVEVFGNYLSNYKNKTQFLIITHKKKTMEYADTLYGITMQESGVSKLVSVKLNEHIDTL